ncbi:alpha/beta hydrolase [Phytohabitans sp. ZYX-F-186]|uniref:Alpha/beta hydrolase n=1 Tax=Phytohabitans maris TaxID=3071409 RepID=A0ABU0ZPD1_9ACTN|nr:alpha/beta hydrolase [Phytohabitans sp. ZYX-F-186]MDQ7908899.1 alpha/beta hydrolase [Phytohabitans sp. ZYX-F-186]
MPTVDLDGIATHYEVVGDGPALLMFAPGGFNATADNWRRHGVYRGLNLVPRLSTEFRLVLFDRRESGRSGGRVQSLSWHDYAVQGKALLDHLGLPRAHLMGGCVGCSVAVEFAVRYPEATDRLVLYSPAGGVRYRMLQHARFAEHEVFVRGAGPRAVVDLVRAGRAGFSEDARVGPWAPVIRSDPAFAAAYAALDPQWYLLVLRGTARTLFDRDTVPGPEPEELMRVAAPALVVPGEDTSHAPSAARYLQECLPAARHWDMRVAGQTEEATIPVLLDFLRG